MKASIQMYGIIITFALFLFLIPQLLGIAMLYREINSVASYITEVIEVHEGISNHNEAEEIIQDKLNKYPKLMCTFSKEEMNKFYTYNVKCSKETWISILNIPFELSVKKVTRRVIY